MRNDIGSQVLNSNFYECPQVRLAYPFTYRIVASTIQLGTNVIFPCRVLSPSSHPVRANLLIRSILATEDSSEGQVTDQALSPRKAHGVRNLREWGKLRCAGLFAHPFMF